ncbi:hypothetical protein ACFLYC_03465 [Chloroflexota bacterium]
MTSLDESHSPPDVKLTSDELAYSDILQENISILTGNINILLGMFQDYIQNNMLNNNTVELATMANAQLDTIQMVTDEIREVEPPSSMSHIHNKYMQAMEQYNSYITSVVPEVIDNIDSGLMSQAISDALACLKLLNEASNLLTEFIEEH